MALSLLIRCLLLLPLWESVIVLCFVVRYFMSKLVLYFILIGKRELVALISLSCWCHVIVVWLFLAVLWVCLQFVIAVFPDDTHLLLSKDFHSLNNQSLICRHLVFTVTTTGTKGHTLESCIVYLCSLEDSHNSQGQ